MKRREFLPAMALPLLSGCASALAWVGAVTSAIEIARRLIAKVSEWFGEGGTYRDIPGVPSSIYSEIDAVIRDALALLDKSEEATKAGADAQGKATEAYQASRVLIVDRLLALLAKLGWYNPRARQLVQPVERRSLRADGTAEPAEVIGLELPPEHLQ